MPTSDKIKPEAWQNWQPRNLVDDFIPILPAAPQATLTLSESGELPQADLDHLRHQAEQQGFAKGLAQGLEEGRKRGFDAGFTEGHRAGFEKGSAEARDQVSQDASEHAAFFDAFRSSLQALESLMPSRLVQLALTAARQMIGNHANIDPTLLLEKIRQLMAQDTLLNGHITVHVNPAEAEQIKTWFATTLNAADWEVRPDEQVLPGGCRIRSEESEIDATLNTRWQELCQLVQEDKPA